MAEQTNSTIKDIAQRYYSGNEEHAFLHWAFQCILADLDPDDDEISEHIALDGPGDLGIDGYWVDEVNKRLVLVQAKSSGRVNRDIAASFRGSIEFIRDPEYVRDNGNDVWADVYPDVLENILDESYSIYAVLACGGRVMPGASKYVRTDGSQVWQFDFEGVTKRKDMQMEALNEDGLRSLERSLLDSAQAPPPKVSLPVSIEKEGPSFHSMGGDFHAVQATVLAQALVETYAQYRSSIFKLNPRGPLGSNKANEAIEETLGDPTLKRYFHLLNNGLTVLCDTVTYDETSQTLEVDNFQVVNGCQTVYTLFTSRNKLSDDVRVPVRIVQSMHAPWVAKEIPRATNRQTAVRPEQLASLGEEHDRLERLFDEMDPPWFYDKQQGYTRFLTAGGQKVHKQKYGKRIITITHAGQFGAAFLGYPILATYDKRMIFEQVEGEGEALYRTLFLDENQPEQLLLPVMVGRQVYDVVKQRKNELKMWTEGLENEQFSEKTWLSYARMHIVALIGQLLHHRSGIPQGSLLTPSASQELRDSIDVWFSECFDKAREAVRFYIRAERRADRLSNLRNFFRDRDIFEEMVEEVSRK